MGWGRGDWDADCDCDSDGVPMRLTSPLPSGLGGRMGGVPEYIMYRLCYFVSEGKIGSDVGVEVR